MRSHALVPALCLAGTPAIAGSASSRFNVGAVVVQSATVSVTAAGNGLRVEQVSRRGIPPPMLLAGGKAGFMLSSTRLRADGDLTVTILY